MSALETRMAENNGIPPDPPAGVELTPEEWDGLHDVAMSLHGVLRLIDEGGFENSTGAQELLVLVQRRFESLLARVRERHE